MVRARSIKQFCADYGVGKDTIYDAHRKGRLPFVKLGRKNLITHEDGERWFASLPKTGGERHDAAA